MQLLLDPFDTEILGKNVYKLYLKEDRENEFLKLIRKVTKGIIFCFTPFSSENINLLQRAGFILISIRSTYILDLNSYLKRKIGNFAKGYKILNRKESIKILQKKYLIQLASTIYRTSRYSKDKFLEKSGSEQIYISWINNSLYNNYADEAFLVFNKLTPVGIITIKIKGKNGFIDLLGIIEEHQKQKLATYLLKKAIEYLIKQDIDDIFVITEGENIPANKLYQKNNFILQNMELVYHKHI